MNKKQYLIEEDNPSMFELHHKILLKTAIIMFYSSSVFPPKKTLTV